MQKIRVRFAPSPTGFLHLGSARTALFNWLYARHTGGTFVLRIEDTDKERSKTEYLDEILEDLKWMGIDWDEGPLFQSQRVDMYKKAALRLLEEGLAYKEGEAIIYKVPKDRVVKIDDLIHGEIQFNTNEIKDQVLMKSDGSAAYNFACVVDDADLGITHIIRGDDHISNTPKQIMFYEVLGLQCPRFAHMPLMMGKDGAKLSKRHGGVSVSEYKQEGFLPEAMVNYLMLLGWSPGEGKEIITLKEAVKYFDVKDINNVQAKFDIDKLRWINGEYIKQKPVDELFQLLREKLLTAGIITGDIDKEYLLNIIKLYQTRFKTFDEFIMLTRCFFSDDYPVDEKARQKHLGNEEGVGLLKKFSVFLSALEDFSAVKIEEVCRELCEKEEVKAAKLIHPVRIAVSGISTGAGLFEMMELLGKDKTLVRIKKATGD
ncbi:MAG: glutamate--tRNA ligase [Candidatus Omnitrophota bacterium]